MTIARSITELIGGTPLVRLNRISDETGAEVLGKLESANPGGSVKDRIGLAMIEAAEEEGLIAPGRTTIVEPTSGNTGIALAMVAAARGYDLILTMPETMSVERRNLLKAYGARLVLTPGPEGMRGAVARAARGRRRAARRLRAAAVREPRQPRDPLPDDGAGDLGRHRRRRRRLRRRRRHRRHDHRRRAGSCARRSPPCASSPSSPPTRRCSPAASRGRTRSRASAPASCRKVLDTGVYDEIVRSSADEAFAAARALARDEGLLVGISAGANVWAAAEVAQRPESRGTTIVTVLCDTGERYLSTPLFTDPAEAGA